MSLWPTTVAAQDSQPAEATAVPGGEPPTETSTQESLGVADIPREADTARAEIRELILASQPGEVVEEITEHYPPTLRRWRSAFAESAEGLDAEEVRDFCRGKLAGYKIPRTVVFVEELPLSPVGKMLRQKVRELYGEA